VSGEAILSAENSGKPLGGRGSALTPLGSSQRSPAPYLVGRGLLPPRTLPSLSTCPSVLAPMKNPGRALGRTPKFGSSGALSLGMGGVDDP